MNRLNRSPLLAMSLVAASFAFLSGAGLAQNKSELEGKWQLVKIDKKGKETMPKDPSIMQVLGDKMQITGKDKAGKEKTGEGTIKLDPKKNPKEVDLNYSSGDQAGKMILGIYEIKGDTLRISVGTKTRPTEFKGMVLEYQKMK